MRFDLSQNMKLSQQMKLAPRMIQSMEILQMPLLALQERINEELESNIALEQLEPGSDLDSEQERPTETETEPEQPIGERELVVGENAANSSDDFERLESMESTNSEAFDNDYAPRLATPQREGERDRKMDAMANIAARGESLVEQLLHDWSLMDLDEQLADVGRKLIAYIDDDGLIRTDLATILDQNQHIPGVEMNMPLLEQALKEVQLRLEPAGIGARTVCECLLLQIDAIEFSQENNDDWSDARLLIEEHFDDLLQNRLPKIARDTEISIERIGAAKELLSRLNLSPGRDLVDEQVPPIIPDVIVDFDEQADAYVAHLAGNVLPQLRVVSDVEKMAKDKSNDKPTREFASNSVSTAKWLIDALNQRRNTLLRVVNVVLARQRDYFDLGPQHLKPLPMIEVADQLGIHVGTVSRAANGKWMQTPRGIVPLRRFFSGGMETGGGESMSWEAVKATLQEIIDAEDKSNPFNDDSLSAELQKKGIDIARRTVVKYRQQLDIPPARRRKVHG